MERCEECGFVYGEHRPEDLADVLNGLACDFGERLRTGSDGERARLLSRRVSPEVWSVVEYACHVRDVLLVQRGRLILGLVEGRPSFAPMYRDERVTLAGYAEEAPETVAAQIEMAASLAARAFGKVDEAGFGRRCLYNYPKRQERTLGWLAQNTWHEMTHHLDDIDRVVAAPMGE